MVIFAGNVTRLRGLVKARCLPKMQGYSRRGPTAASLAMACGVEGRRRRFEAPPSLGHFPCEEGGGKVAGPSHAAARPPRNRAALPTRLAIHQRNRLLDQ